MSMNPRDKEPGPTRHLLNTNCAAFELASAALRRAVEAEDKPAAEAAKIELGKLVDRTRLADRVVGPTKDLGALFGQAKRARRERVHSDHG